MTRDLVFKTIYSSINLLVFFFFILIKSQKINNLFFKFVTNLHLNIISITNMSMYNSIICDIEFESDSSMDTVESELQVESFYEPREFI